jgi:hypothetical protein
MIRSRLVRGLLAASPTLAFLAWYLLARPAGDVIAWIVLAVAAVASFLLHRYLPRAKD